MLKKKFLLVLLFIGICFLSCRIIKNISFPQDTITQNNPEKEKGTLIIQSYDNNVKYYVFTLNGTKIGCFKTNQENKIKKSLPAGYYKIQRENTPSSECTLVPICELEKTFFQDKNESISHD